MKQIDNDKIKDFLLNEMEFTRTAGCPYLQCDEMWFAWNKAFDEMKKVVNQLLS